VAYSPLSLRLAVESLFDVVPSRSTRDELVFICPLCGDQTGNRSVNLKTGKTGCWRCKSGGDFVRWCRSNNYDVDLESPAVPTMGELDQLVGSLDAEEKPMSSFVTEVELPRGFTKLADVPRGAYATLIGRMAVKKHLSLDDFIKAGVGFTRDDPKWEPYAIFPVFEWGRVVYYQGRTYTDVPGQATKRFPSRSVLPVGSGNWVYNWDKLRGQGGVAVIVEAILNVLSVEKELAQRGLAGYVPVALFKHKVSKPQLVKILSCRGLKEVALMYDGGFTDDADADAANFSSHVKTTVVELPGKDDPNDKAAQAVDLLLQRRAPRPGGSV
jgi:hypothetical protein